MIEKSRVDLISQIISSMEDASIKLEEAYKSKNAGSFAHAKKETLEFQKTLSRELKNK